MVALQLLAYTVAGHQAHVHGHLHKRSLLEKGSSSFDCTTTYTTFYGEPTCMYVQYSRCGGQLHVVKKTDC